VEEIRLTLWVRDTDIRKEKKGKGGRKTIINRKGAKQKGGGLMTVGSGSKRSRH